MKKKYLFFDVDGTLTSFKEYNSVPESGKRAIEKVKKAGHFVCIATGRPVDIARSVFDKVDIHNAVCEGGLGVILDDEVRSLDVFHEEDVKDIIRQCEEIGLWYSAEVDNPHILTTSFREFADMAPEGVGAFSLHYEENFDPTSIANSIKRIIVYNDPKKTSLLRLPQGIGCMSYPDVILAFVEPDDKYAGIKKAMELVKGMEEDIIVFGDGLNDISMFKKAPYSVAMGNAVEELKELADYITDSVDEDGLYNACEHLGLFEKVE